MDETEVVETAVEPGEPVFVLRAKDRLAPMVLELYALSCKAAGSSQATVDKVRRQAYDMRLWQAKRGSVVPE